MRTNLLTAHIWHVGLLLAALTLAACSKDDGIDFDDIDTTIGIELDEFTLSGGNSTHEIALEEVFDISSSDIISTDAEGNYIFAQGVDDVNPAHPRVEPVIINLKNEPVDYQIQVSQLDLSGVTQLPASTSQAIIETAVSAAYSDLPATIAPDAMGRVNMFELATNHDDDIVSLSRVVTKTGQQLSAIDVNIGFSSDLKAIVSRVSQMSLRLPAFIQYSATLQRTATSQPETVSTAGGLITLNNVGTSDLNRLHISVEGLSHFNEQSLTDADYLVCDAERIALKAGVDLSFQIAKADISENGLKSLLVQLVQNGQQPDFHITSATQLYDIEISEVEGQFNPDINLTDGIGRFDINDLPDFLNDDEVQLVLDNPMIELSLTSNVDLETQITNAVITGHYSNGRADVSVPVENFKVKRHSAATGSTTTRVLIADKPGLISGDYDARPATKGNSLAELIRYIPDYVTFDCKPSVVPGTTGKILLGHDYNIQPQFEFKAPLALNDGTIIVYTDSIDGWNGDLDDLDLVPGTKVVLRANVESQVPMNLSLTTTMLGIDPQGKHYDLPESKFAIKVETDHEGNVIAGGTSDNKAQTKLTITVEQKTADAFKELDGVRFRAMAYTPAGITGQVLNKDKQKLRLTDIKATVTGKLKINTDD